MQQRSEIVDMMRRVGMGNQVGEAQQTLAEVVDLDRDDHLVYQLALTRDQNVNRLGGSAW